MSAPRDYYEPDPTTCSALRMFLETEEARDASRWLQAPRRQSARQERSAGHFLE